MQYVIIGNSAAAIGAVEGIRRVDRANPIILVADEPYPTYSRPLISYYLEGRIEETGMGYRPPGFYTENGVTTRLETKVERIDTELGQVVLDTGEILPYDRLLLAAGSRPVVPPIKGIDTEGVYFFNRFDDVRALRSQVRHGCRAAVVGAGLTGLKAAEALAHLGLRVTVADISPFVLSTIIDATGAEIVRGHLEESGVHFLLGTPAVGVTGIPAAVAGMKDEWKNLKEKYRKVLVRENRVDSLVFTDGFAVPVDVVILATGVRPNLEIVEGSGIAVNQGILVDERLQTNIPGIYAAGDISEGWDLVTRERRVIATLPNAYKQGEVAGINMAGGNAEYPGGMQMNSVNFFGLSIATAGRSNVDDAALEVVTRVDSAHRVYRRMTLRDGRLVGFICIGDVGRAGILTALIRNGVPVGGWEERLLEGDFGIIDLPVEVRRNWQLA